jgi:phosphoglycolate phosphatase-like HAD superfamily hydrolase
MKLILFDIDGTLIWPDGAGREAMTGALIEVFGTAGAAATLPMAGKTDWQIITEILTVAGLSQRTIDANLSACFRAAARHMIQTTRTRRIRTCPGVPGLLARLSAHPKVTLGLLTGNAAATAPIKLRAANLEPALFRVGAYGSDACARSQLLEVAIRRARALTGLTFTGKDVFTVGDTPADVSCGRHLGASAIGVATGHYAPETLHAAGANYVFPDLTDTEAITQVLME